MSNRAQMLAFCLGAALALTTAQPAGANWLQEAVFNCSDPMLLRNQGFLRKWLARPVPVSRIEQDAEHVAVEIDQKFINSGEVAPGKFVTVNHTEFGTDDAAILKAYLERRERGVDIPFWSQQTPALAGYVFSATQGLAFGVMFAYLFDTLGVAKASIATLETFVADGGFIDQFASLNEANDRQVLTEIVQYSVKVGRETRNFALYSCAYPGRVVMRRVRTTTPAINAKTFEDGGSEWLMKNAQTGAIERRLKKTGEDKEFYYFSEAGNIPPPMAMTLRISRLGGAVQRKSDDSWQSLYTATEVF